MKRFESDKLARLTALATIEGRADVACGGLALLEAAHVLDVAEPIAEATDGAILIGTNARLRAFVSEPMFGSDVDDAGEALAEALAAFDVASDPAAYLADLA